MTAVLYNGNAFRVYIDASAHHTASLNSPLIFGLFGDPHRIHLVRDFRRIRLTMDIDDLNTYGIIRLRARVQHLVNTLKEHANDETQKSLLKGLHVRFLLHGHNIHFNRRCRHLRGHSWQQVEQGNNHIMKHMFALEPLVELHALEEVRVVGCPEWFTQCLEMRLRGEGGRLSKMAWPVRIRRRRVGFKKYRKVEVSARQCWQPVYHWLAFAERNGIRLPDEFYM